MLDTLDFSCRAERGILRVFRDIMLVMKGKLKNGLYILQSNIVVGGTTISSISNLDQTWLEDMRLSNMSECGMNEFSKRDFLGR